MFSDINTEVIGFDSVPGTERLVSDMGSQTSDIKTSTQSTQTASSQSTATEASPDVLNIEGDHPYDADKLLKFLNRVLPHLEEELKCSDFNTALNFNLEFGNTMTEEQEKLEQSCRTTTLKPDFCEGMFISSLSWNTSNVTLAVGFSMLSHAFGCVHESSIVLYNTEKAQFEKNPSEILKVSACVKYIAFHTHIPSLLAAGLHNGDIILWDLKHDKEVLMKNKKESGAPHSHEITFLTWRDDETGSWLITAGRDGKIILWSISITNLTYEVHQTFIMRKQHLTSTREPEEYLEVLHMDFLPSRTSYFIAACGGGSTFYCSLTMAKPFTPECMDPVLETYKQRKGVITCVSCNPDVFATCGTDSEIQIFQYNHASPILRIHTIYSGLGLKWNSHTELICWGGSYVECHRVKRNGRTVICALDEHGDVSTVAFKTQPSIYINNQCIKPDDLPSEGLNKAYRLLAYRRERCHWWNPNR